MPNPLITDAIERLASGQDLDAPDAAAVLREIMEGNSSDAQTAGFLIALRAKGETVEEIVGLARAMRDLAATVPVDRDDLLDTAGTGGGCPTFNVSTAAALVAAGAGCAVAKHGNRSNTSQCGSADVLEALGARIDLEPAAVADCIESVGFGFMFAPAHHAAMRHVVPVRKELAVRTAFNFLGPLTNPAGATRQVIGVSDPAFMAPIASALGELGGVHALVVSSDDGLDEISVSAASLVVELKGGKTNSFSVTPEELGVERAPLEQVRAGTPPENAEIVRSVLRGDAGAERSLTVVNAAAAIYAGGRADSLEEGARKAEQAIDSGEAERTLVSYVERTRALAPAA